MRRTTDEILRIAQVYGDKMTWKGVRSMELYLKDATFNRIVEVLSRSTDRENLAIGGLAFLCDELYRKDKVIQRILEVGSREQVDALTKIINGGNNEGG